MATNKIFYTGSQEGNVEVSLDGGENYTEHNLNDLKADGGLDIGEISSLDSVKVRMNGKDPNAFNIIKDIKGGGFQDFKIALARLPGNTYPLSGVFQKNRAQHSYDRQYFYGWWDTSNHSNNRLDPIEPISPLGRYVGDAFNYSVEEQAESIDSQLNYKILDLNQVSWSSGGDNTYIDWRYNYALRYSQLSDLYSLEWEDAPAQYVQPDPNHPLYFAFIRDSDFFSTKHWILNYYESYCASLSRQLMIDDGLREYAELISDNIDFVFYDKENDKYCSYIEVDLQNIDNIKNRYEVWIAKVISKYNLEEQEYETPDGYSYNINVFVPSEANGELVTQTYKPLMCVGRLDPEQNYEDYKEQM